MAPPKKLLDQVRETIRLKHYSRSTEKTYALWIKRFILFHKKRHPLEMGEREIEAFLSSLAIQGKVSASTQNRAFNALLFLYRHVLFGRYWSYPSRNFVGRCIARRKIDGDFMETQANAAYKKDSRRVLLIDLSPCYYWRRRWNYHLELAEWNPKRTGERRLSALLFRDNSSTSRGAD